MTIARQLHNLFQVYGKVLSLIVTMFIGALVPQASALAFMVQYLLMTMLFFAFLDIEINIHSFQKGVLWVLAANLAITFGAYKIFSLFNEQLALAAFITAIAPTAIASTVIVGFIQGRVDFMVASVLLTNIAMAVIIPLVLPGVLGAATQISTWEVLQPVLITVFTPLILARLAMHLPLPARTIVQAGKRFSFPVWLFNLFIISAKASDFLRSETSNSVGALFQVALVALIICVINFAIGAKIGGRQFWQEASQALGQKNNSFAIWIALTFINPLVAMGPTFYVLYQNLYNTWQIYRFERRNKNPL